MRDVVNELDEPGLKPTHGSQVNADSLTWMCADDSANDKVAFMNLVFLPPRPPVLV